MLITLTRTLFPDRAEGSLLVGMQTFATLELPWRNDQPDVSCVPIGTYDLNPYESPVKGLVYRLHNPQLGVYGYGVVPPGGRSAVEMHPGNWVTDSLGCILVGRLRGQLINPKTDALEPAILQSQEAMTEFRHLLGNTVTHTLAIVAGVSS